MEVNGWRLFQHALFKAQFDKLLEQSERIQKQQPLKYKSHKTVKLLARVTKIITQEIPADPGHDRFNQGNTLGSEYRHWKRTKFGRYRLFFRFYAKRKVVIYAWINDEITLRKEGDKNDPYALFFKGLEKGEPPDSIDELLKQTRKVNF